jgi:Putative peptidoglycan binding domain/PKD domain/L,D-transpeptidase catalytic domain
MRILAVALAAFALTASASAAPPVVTVTASPAKGAAPLTVLLRASGDAATYHWDLGDGTTAEGAQVTHAYPAGSFTATVTATGVSGETAQARVAVSATPQTISLNAPRVAEYEAAVVLTGQVRPARRGTVRIYRSGRYVTTVRSGRAGRYSARILLRAPGPFEARFGAARSDPRTIRVRPRLETELAATAPLNGKLLLTARVVPRPAGKARVVVRRGGRIIARRVGSRLRLRLPTARAGELRVAIAIRPRRGYAPAARALTSRVVLPSLALGARGASVLALERRLAELRYALPRIDSLYAGDTVEAVLAFQKVHGLPRTGRVDPSIWRKLARATVPRPRYGGGNRIEVDKTRQVLFEIIGGEVARIVHVSTGATGNTPLGRWQVYRKVPGYDWVLWYPLYFLRGFAIHGYPSVPAYPASHGCVRVPMWIAPALYARHGHGATIVVYA